MGTSRVDQARGRAAGTAIVALGISNLLTNRVLPEAAYVPWNLALAGGLVALARHAGCSDEELGLDRRHLDRGTRLGAVLAAGITAAHATTWASGRGRGVFHDRRVTDLGAAAAWSQAVVRIPLGTVLAEEVAFRGVLPALLASPRNPWRARTLASALFGLWHVLPSQSLAGQNQGAGQLAARTGRAGVPVLAVVTTAVAGAVLHDLRRRGRHLAAPILVHLATNLSGFVAARAAAP